MKPKLYTILLVTLGVALFSCKTASKLYERGDYQEAVELAAKKLQKDPNDQKLIDIIRQSYEYAVNDRQGNIRDYTASTSELKWEYLYNEYANLQKMYDAIYKVPSVFGIVHPTDYSSYMSTYAEKAGEARFQRGVAFMQRYDKKSYQSAYREFQAALKFIPGDREVINHMNEAYDYAVTNIVILPMQQQGGYVYSSYNVGGENLDDQLIRNLQYSSGSEFVKFYSAWDARSRNIRVDKELDMRLVTVDIGRYYDNRSTRRVSKDVVVKETVYKADSVVKEYAKVYADITTTRRIMNSNAVLQVTVRDADGRWLWSDNYNGDYQWTTDFATFTGDARALSDADKQLVNRRADFPPGESTIMRQLLDDISDNAIYGIRNYFNRY